MTDLRRTALASFFVLTLLLSSGAFSPLWTDPTAHDRVVEGGPALQAVWAVCYAIAFLLLLPHSHSVIRFAKSNPFFVGLTLLCLLSVAWSADPTLTLRKFAAILGTTLLGLLLAARFDLRGQLRLVTVALTLAAFASVFAHLFVAPRFAVTETVPGAWSGIFSHKNIFGRIMALGFIASLSLPRRHHAHLFCAGSCALLFFSLVIASDSKTALFLVLIAALLAVSLPVARFPWKEAAGLAALLTATAVPALALALTRSTDLTNFLHRDETLTGRSRIWGLALDCLSRHPWTGYGYGAFWWVAGESRQALALLAYPTPHAHNGLLDLGLQLGWLGILLFVLACVTALYRALVLYRNHTSPEALWPIAFLVFLAVLSCTESVLLVPNSLLSILFVSVAANTSRIQELACE